MTVIYLDPAMNPSAGGRSHIDAHSLSMINDTLGLLIKLRDRESDPVCHYSLDAAVELLTAVISRHSPTPGAA
jgi:hypothetical protein